MEITNNFSITKRKADGKFITVIGGVQTEENDAKRISELSSLYDRLRAAYSSEREDILNNWIDAGRLSTVFAPTGDPIDATTGAVIELTVTEYLERGLDSLINFFKEFSFEPNFRFVNTLAYKLNGGDKSAPIDYIERYFELIDSPYVNEVRDKMKSKEFKLILSDIKRGGVPCNTVNKRFKVYYGSAGTGKTTLAQTESEQRCIVCNNSMLPADLMEDFCFEGGKPSFKPSVLWDCMINGKPIVLDEINLLPFDSLRFLQGVLDGKKEFTYKGRTVTIADGFMVIGTMNLSINGMVYGLPEPLVDRSADFQKFSLDAKTLARAILSEVVESAESTPTESEEVKPTIEISF